MPKWGLAMKEGRIAGWLVEPCGQTAGAVLLIRGDLENNGSSKVVIQ